MPGSFVTQAIFATETAPAESAHTEEFFGIVVPLLYREALEEVLPVAGVLIRSPLFPPAPLFSPVMVGKAKEEGAFQEVHRIAKRWKRWEQEIIPSLVHLCRKDVVNFGNGRTHKHKIKCL